MNGRLDFHELFDCLLKATGHLKITNKSFLFKDNKSREKKQWLISRSAHANNQFYET